MRAGWMRPSAIRRLDRLLGHLAAVGIEAGEDDRAGRVVDDQVDAGGELERADVAPLAADDAALEIVARQVDDRDRGLDGVLGGAALDGLGDVLLGLGRRPISRASASSRFSRLAESWRASPSICLSSSSLASSAVRLATRSSSCCCWRDQLLVLGGRCVGLLFAAATQVCSRARSSFSSRSIDDCRSVRLGVAADAASARAPAPAAAPGAPAARPRSSRSCAFSLASRRVSLRRVSASRSASLTMRQRLFFGAADRFGGDALAIRRPRRRTPRRAGHEVTSDVDEISEQSATRVTSFPVTHIGLSSGRRRAGECQPREI